MIRWRRLSGGDEEATATTKTKKIVLAGWAVLDLQGGEGVTLMSASEEEDEDESLMVEVDVDDRRRVDLVIGDGKTMRKTTRARQRELGGEDECKVA